MKNEWIKEGREGKKGRKRNLIIDVKEVGGGG